MKNIGYLYSDESLQSELDNFIESNKAYFENNPQKDLIIENKKKEIWCLYGGGKFCDEVFQSLREEKKQELVEAEVSAEDIESRLNKYILQLKCSYVYQVTYDDCKELIF